MTAVSVRSAAGARDLAGTGRGPRSAAAASRVHLRVPRAHAARPGEAPAAAAPVVVPAAAGIVAPASEVCA
ncbi:hypothetical protein OG883_01660 [Streptomyces sp. NBC_01142]|uniref:hypothetical protein n=1 Tax=Streptomyces sp. NBC_01142 TaxID=2975865 RepID=UPI002253F096|nr:hypothetical protein [Streptomyces sp. NBC_01142]MCX4818630.1 hypothetical protein [Streptomyces sp. NBC_01142]